MKGELMDNVVETLAKTVDTGNDGDGLHCTVVIWYHKNSPRRSSREC